MEDSNAPAARGRRGAEGLETLGSHALILPAQGNTLAVCADRGHVPAHPDTAAEAARRRWSEDAA